MDGNLNLLEQKIVEAVALIKELRTENQRLSSRCEVLSAQVQGLEIQVEGLEAQVEGLEAQVEGLGTDRDRLAREMAAGSSVAGDIESYEEKRKEVEERVGGLLQKLAALG